MKKLNLDTNALRVDSFQTDSGDGSAGTVFGHVTNNCPTGLGCGTEGDCWSQTCDTFHQTCGGSFTCIRTCQGLTCNYETCGDCNETDQNCTTVCI
ncbi:MAG TPA: hypothetical protein VFQ39_10635 [Longimicrobium sp.]|nr:hypothetical protein [Longimicrobium sp.]